MKVNEIQAKGPVEEIFLSIESIDEPRDVRDGSLRVATATAGDDTGSVCLTLWNEETGRVHVGDIIKITKGWAGEYQGKIQLSAGKFGRIEVIVPAPKKKSEPA